MVKVDNGRVSVAGTGEEIVNDILILIKTFLDYSAKKTDINFLKRMTLGALLMVIDDEKQLEELEDVDIEPNKEKVGFYDNIAVMVLDTMEKSKGEK